MDALPSITVIQETANLWIARILAFDVPAPDAALLFAFALLLFAIRSNARAATDRSRSEVESIYQAELLTANRRAQQARGDLRKAQLEIERERQKRRRDAISTGRTARRAPPKLIDVAAPKAS